jgi:hypothetical protein
MDISKLEAAMAISSLAKMFDKPIERNYGDTEMQDALVRQISLDAAQRFVNSHKNKDFLFSHPAEDLKDKTGDIRQGAYGVICSSLMAYLGDFESVKQSLIHNHGATPEEAAAYLTLCLEDMQWIQKKMESIIGDLGEKGMKW